MCLGQRQWQGKWEGREAKLNEGASESAKEEGPERRVLAPFQGLFIQTLLNKVYIKAGGGLLQR